MSRRINVIIYYDSEVCDTENGVTFLLENTTRLAFNQNTDWQNWVNFHVVKSKSEKFEGKRVVPDGSCLWKIMVSVRNKIGL